MLMLHVTLHMARLWSIAAFAACLVLKLIIRGPHPDFSQASVLLSQERLAMSQVKDTNVIVGLFYVVNGICHTGLLHPDGCWRVVGNHSKGALRRGRAGINELDPVVSVYTCPDCIVLRFEGKYDVAIGQMRRTLEGIGHVDTTIFRVMEEG